MAVRAPLGEAAVQAPREDAGLAQDVQGLGCEHAERSATVGDHLAVAGDLGEATLQLLERDGDRPGEVARLVLLNGSDIDHDRILPPDPVEQLLSTDRLELVAPGEVITRDAGGLAPSGARP